jgi:hypothetical protein
MGLQVSSVGEAWTDRVPVVSLRTCAQTRSIARRISRTISMATLQLRPVLVVAQTALVRQAAAVARVCLCLPDRVGEQRKMRSLH